MRDILIRNEIYSKIQIGVYSKSSNDNKFLFLSPEDVNSGSNMHTAILQLQKNCNNASVYVTLN